MNALDFFIELAIAAAHVEPCIECGDWVAYWMPSEAYYHVGSEARPCWFHYSWEADMPTTLTFFHSECQGVPMPDVMVKAYNDEKGRILAWVDGEKAK
jgi:hypothetical protein